MDVLQTNKEVIRKNWISEIHKNSLNYQMTGARVSTINIYELSHKYKEWLIKKGWILTITYHGNFFMIKANYQAGYYEKVINEFGKNNDVTPLLIKICEKLYLEEVNRDLT